MKCAYCGCENIAGADVCRECDSELASSAALAPPTPIERHILDKPLAVIPLAPPPTVGLNTPLGEVIELLRQRHVGVALVTQEDALLGVFSERDVLTRIGDAFEALRNEPIRRFMTRDPEALDINAPIAFALNRMDLGHYRHVPVLRDGVPVGVLSIRRILNYLAQQYPEILSA